MNSTTQVSNSIVQVDSMYTVCYVYCTLCKNYRTFRKMDHYLSPNYLLFKVCKCIIIQFK
jgi:hypothetical protein